MAIWAGSCRGGHWPSQKHQGCATAHAACGRFPHPPQLRSHSAHQQTQRSALSYGFARIPTTFQVTTSAASWECKIPFPCFGSYPGAPSTRDTVIKVHPKWNIGVSHQGTQETSQFKCVLAKFHSASPVSAGHKSLPPVSSGVAVRLPNSCCVHHQGDVLGRVKQFQCAGRLEVKGTRERNVVCSGFRSQGVCTSEHSGSRSIWDGASDMALDTH